MQRLGDPRRLEGLKRFGIHVAQQRFGLNAPQFRALARELGKNHALALQLWDTGNTDARILATLVDEPTLVTEAQMERWARDFDSWDVCDSACCYLFDKTGIAYRKAVEWSAREEEFVKRAGFALMAYLAVHDKRAPDAAFERFLPIIEREAGDERNFVKKAVNWALRQIGKRNSRLNRRAIAAARRIRKLHSRTARWIASDALRELQSEAVERRLRAGGAERRQYAKPG